MKPLKRHGRYLKSANDTATVRYLPQPDGSLIVYDEHGEYLAALHPQVVKTPGIPVKSKL